MIVSLPMYDWPELREPHDAFWTRLRGYLLASGIASLPFTLTRGSSATAWLEPDLALSQTCSYPMNHQLGNAVALLGTPCYSVDFFSNGYYASPILVRKTDSSMALDEYRDTILAFNSPHSQSGYNALRNLLHSRDLLHEMPFFSSLNLTGSHRASVVAVADGEADLCALDPVSWKLAQQFEPATSELRILCHTQYTPALPLICSASLAQRSTSIQGAGVTALGKSVRLAWAKAADSAAGQQLHMNGIANIARSCYQAVPVLETSLSP